MTTSHGRRIQGRRALAILAWVSLVIIAAMLWYGQEKDIIRIQAWEPAALLLSGYSAFLAIFGWLLFAPERSSAEESPALFFSGMLTLIPPCFIAYNLMPPSSPLRGWLTIGIFVFGLFAILSPLPKEVFAVPRDRKSYLQPLTDCYLSMLDVEEPQLELQSLVPRTYYTLRENDTQERTPRTDTSGRARDPWTDPFYGTGRQISEVGATGRKTISESRSRTTDRLSSPNQVLDRTPEKPRPQDSSISSVPVERTPGELTRPEAKSTYTTHPPEGPPFQEPSRRLSEDQDLSPAALRRNSPPDLPTSTLPPTLPAALPPIAPPTNPNSSSTTRPPMTARSAFSPRDSRAPHYRPSVAGTDPSSTQSPTVESGIANTPPRRPLSEPVQESRPSVGFQSPSASRPAVSTASPAAANLATPTSAGKTTGSGVKNAGPVIETSELATGLSAFSSAPSLASPATFDDALKSAVSEFRSINAPGPSPPASTASRPLLDKSSRQELISPAENSPSTTTESKLLELDRQMRELEAEEDRVNDRKSQSGTRFDSPHTADEQMESLPPTGTPSRLNDVRMERIRDEFGGEMIDGTIKVFFEEGQKRAHLHVPFSPPMPGLPEVECEPIDDDLVRLKVGVRQPYGIRIEARRSDASSALNTEIGFAAVYTPVARRN